jgi:hypothetical protein
MYKNSTLCCREIDLVHERIIEPAYDSACSDICKNMMESNIFHTNDIADFLFCLIAGIFLAYSYEQLPLSRKMKDFMCRISDAESRRKEKIPRSALR